MASSQYAAVQDTDWQQQSNQALIEHILTRYHQEHRQQLQRLIELAERVESVHRSDANCPIGLTQHLRMMQTELDQHMQKEELILFPMLASGHAPMASGPISVMMAEHQDHLHAIATIYQLTHDLKLPDNGCNSWGNLYQQLAVFIEDINTHMHLENDILFAR